MLNGIRKRGASGVRSLRCTQKISITKATLTTPLTTIRLAGDVYQINYLPMKLTPTDFLMIVGATLVLSFFATIIPARRAGSLQPVDVLRYE